MAARRLHALVYATIASCCLVIAVISVSLGTDEWFSADMELEVNTAVWTTTAKYGLFKGEKTRSHPTKQRYDLQIVCDISKSKCMFSCGTTAELRKQDLERLLSGNYDELDNLICTGEGSAVASKGVSNVSSVRAGRAAEGFEPVFLNFGLYVTTIAFLALAIFFAVLSGGLAVYNTYRTPFQPILSVFGLYIWNGITAGCVLLAMIMWIVAFTGSLSKNAGINDTLTGTFDSDGKGKLGISFWILILGLILPLVNIGILAYRSWKITKMEETNIKVMSEKLESGDILLF